MLESSGYDADNQTALGEKTEKEVEPMLIFDEFGGSQEAGGKSEAEELPNAAVKDVHAAGMVYSRQPYGGGARYAGRDDRTLYANSPFSGSFQHRTNVLDDFHGRGWFETEFRLSTR